MPREASFTRRYAVSSPFPTSAAPLVAAAAVLEPLLDILDTLGGDAAAGGRGEGTHATRGVGYDGAAGGSVLIGLSGEGMKIKPRLWPLTGPTGLLAGLAVGLLMALFGSAGLPVALAVAIVAALVGWAFARWNARPRHPKRRRAN